MAVNKNWAEALVDCYGEMQAQVLLLRLNFVALPQHLSLAPLADFWSIFQLIGKILQSIKKKKTKTFYLLIVL